jgi:hypothetical protein
VESREKRVVKKRIEKREERTGRNEAALLLFHCSLLSAL